VEDDVLLTVYFYAIPTTREYMKILKEQDTGRKYLKRNMDLCILWIEKI
jgi:hypothetical protein